MSRRIYDSLSGLRAAADMLSIVYRGTPVSKEDGDLLRQLLCIRGALLADVSSDCSESAINQYYWALCSIDARTVDAYDLGMDIKALGLALRLYLEKFENGRRDNRRSFLKSVSLRYRGILISPMYGTLDKFLAYPTPELYYELIQFVDILSKVNFTSISIEDLMVAEYDEQEQSMKDWHYDPFILNECHAVILDWFRSYRPNLRGRCHHGGGSTAELSRSERGRILKDASLQFSPTLLRLMSRWGVDVAEVPRFAKIVNEDNRISSLQFVPKSMVTNRVISKEPCSLMWVQQALKDDLYSYFKKHRFIRKVINLEDQSLSADLARKGSVDGSYATLDLSAASDSVSLELVAKLFSDTALLLPLIETRSTHTVYTDKSTKTSSMWKLRKFAPMGSALCFPVECIVFASICEVARRRSGSQRLFRVFGDDLVVPNEYADLVCELLEANHFKVNVRKSYKDSRKFNFREACGGEYFNNVDVTPVRFSRQLKAIGPNPSGAEYSSWIGLKNRLSETGLRAAASYVMQMLRQAYSGPVLDCTEFSNYAGHGILSYGPYTERRPVKYNRDYQRISYVTTHVVARVEPRDRKRVSRLIRDDATVDEVLYEAWLSDSEYRSRSFLPADHILHLPDYIRPDRVVDTSLYPCRDQLSVSPVG